MKKISRREILKYMGTGAALTALPFSGCLGGNGGGNITIGTVLPISGNLKQFGPPMLNGVKLAAKRVNQNTNGVKVEENGEMVNKKINIVNKDSQTASQAANTALQQLINVNGVPAFIGAAGSGVSKSIVETSISQNVVQISPSNTAPYFTKLEDNGYYWRTCASDELQAAAMARYAREEKEHQTASVLYINNSYGQGFSEQFRKWFKNFGGDILNLVGYSGDSATFSSELNSVKEDDPDLIVVVGYPEEGSIILSEAASMGLLGESDWLLSEGLRSDKLAEKVGKSDGEFVIEGIEGTTPDPRVSADAYNAFA